MTEQQRDQLIKLFRAYGDSSSDFAIHENGALDKVLSVSREFYDLIYDIPVSYEET